MFRRVFVCFFIFLSFSFLALANTSPIYVKPLSESLYLIQNPDYGTNIGVVKSEAGLILIDPMPGESRLYDLHGTIQSISNQTVSFVLNTHQHQDHVGGNTFFIERGAIKLNPDSHVSTLRLIKVTSHTGHDVIIYHKDSNTIFTGDVFDNSWHPTFYAGGVKGFIDAIDSILSIGDERTLIIPGHGAITDKNTVKAFKQNTINWINGVKQQLNQTTDVDVLMKKPELLLLLAKFNTQNRVPFIPEKALKRFIERTIEVISTQKHR